MQKLAILNIEGKKKETLDLPDKIFAKRVNTDVIQQAVLKYRASERQGTASTKERADVNGGGKKPYRQKGTGRARHGSIRSPLWKGGGVTFGPHPRDFGYTVPRKIRTAALSESLNAKFHDKEIFCVEDITKDLNKTKEFAQILSVLNLKGKILACLEGSGPNIPRISRNIVRFNLKRTEDVNAYDVMSNKNFLVSKTSLLKLIERIMEKEVVGQKVKKSESQKDKS